MRMVAYEIQLPCERPQLLDTTRQNDPNCYAASHFSLVITYAICAVPCSVTKCLVSNTKRQLPFATVSLFKSPFLL